jgi:glycosyltransferase involved in cell wall biosynthesis
MKLLMVTLVPPQPDSWGAIPVLLHGQLTALRPHHDVTLMTLVADDAEREAVDHLRSSGLEVYSVQRCGDTMLRRLRMATRWVAGRTPKRTIWNYEPRLQQVLDDVLRRRRFDLVHVEDMAAGAYRYRTTTPKILTDYEVLCPRPINWRVWQAQQPVRTVVDELDWRRWRRHQSSIWRRYDRVQVFSRRDARSIEHIAPDLMARVRVNPFCLTLPRECDPAREQPASLLFVGSFLHPPNVDAVKWLVSDIMPRLRRRRPGVTLTIAGGDPRRRIEGLAAEDVTLAGYVPDLAPLLDAATIVVAPVRIGGGQRMKVLYGMAAGKAVVTTPRGAEGIEPAVDARALCIASDAEAFAAATSTLLESAATRRALGLRARALVRQQYAPEAYARRAQALYKELGCCA